MEVKIGYKQTEIGVIPNDWDIDIVDNLASITTGEKNTQDRIDDGVYPFFVRSSVIEHINSYSFDGEAVLTAGDGVGTGKIFHYINGKFDFHQRVYKISEFCDRLNGYYFYLYFSNHFYFRIMQMTAKSSVDSVRREMIANMMIPIPLAKEQTAIATVLSDTDALIEGLERLIVKRRDMKQGVMQKLLTGDQRLPRFNGKWKTKKLGEVLKVRHGKSKRDVISENGEYPILASGGEIGKAKQYIYNKPSVLIGRKGTIDMPQYMDKPFWSVDTLFYTEISEDNHAKFIYYKFLMIEWYSYNEATGVPSLNAKTIENIECLFPNEDKEQSAIADVLSDMDFEINLLEEKLEKYKLIKQGMMQELLTGKTRLI
jgi:type I restriction enzyme, S subunit